MNRLPNGTLVGPPKVRPASHPANVRQEDILLSREHWTQEDQDILLPILDRLQEDYDNDLIV